MSLPKDDSFDFLASSDNTTPAKSRAAQSMQPEPSNNGAGHVAVDVKLPPLPAREEFPFLLSEHPFDSESIADAKAQRDPTAVCLSFAANELAYVHYVHSSGWTDVTLVKSGERGWVPIDYFVGYSDPRAIPLLAAIAAFLANPRSQRVVGLRSLSSTAGAKGPSKTSVSGAVPGASGMAAYQYTFSEPAINEIISGTKLLLDKTQVLSRGAPLVQQFPEVASARKMLLTELAHIVRKAQMHKNSTEDHIIDKFVRSCYRLLDRTLMLLIAVDKPEVKKMVAAANRRQYRLSQVSSKTGSSVRSTSTHSGRSQKSNESSKSAKEEAPPVMYRVHTRDISDNSGHTRYLSAESGAGSRPQSVYDNGGNLAEMTMSSINTNTDDDSSVAADDAAEDGSSYADDAMTDGTAHGTANSTANSTSMETLTASSSTKTMGTNASSDVYRIRSFPDHSAPPKPRDRLQEVVNAFIYYLRGFLNPEKVLLKDPANPNTSPQILALTRHSMLACRELLPVLDLGPADVVDDARDELLEEIRKLVSSARSVVAALPPSPASLLTVASQSLVISASKCLNLCMFSAHESYIYLTNNPGLELASGGTYPAFSQGEHVDLGHPVSHYNNSDGKANGAQRDIASMYGDLRPSRLRKRPADDETSDRVEGRPLSQISPKTSPRSNSQTGLDSLDNFANESLADLSLNSANSSAFSILHNAPSGPPTTPGPMPSGAVGSADEQQQTHHAFYNGYSSMHQQLVPVKNQDGKRRSQEQDRSASGSSLASSKSTSSGALIGKDNESLVFVNGKVRGGPLPNLVAWLTGADYESLEMEIRVFLLCFRLFTTPKELVIELGSLESSSAGVKHFANLWVQSFWEPEDGVLSSLEPLADKNLIKARRKIIDRNSSKNKYKQIVELPLNPDPSSYKASIKKQGSSANSRSASTGSALTALRNNSFGNQFSTQFSTQSALNLAQSFREFSLGNRRASRQGSHDEGQGQGSNGNNGSSSGLNFGSHRHFSNTSQISFSEKFSHSSNGSSSGSASGLGALSNGSTSSLLVNNGEIIDFLLNFASTDVAQQITLMWNEILKNLRASELLDQRFSSSKRSLGLAPHVAQFIQNSNHLSSLVGDTILSPELSNKQRTRVCKQWIRIADDMYTLGNLNGVVSIVAVLQSTRIARLHRVWESLSAKHHTCFERLKPLASLNRNFQEYRQELQRHYGKPCIPYMGCLLNDLTLIDEGNPKTLKATGGINFDKYMRTGHAIAALQPFQQNHYDIQPDVALQAWLRTQMAQSYSRESRDLEEQWRRSLLIQPERD